MTIDIKLDQFEGPLDLLLHLIKKNELDIYDIQLCSITDQYLAILDGMKHLNLEVAGDFLLMAATLLQIKSRQLLPPSEVEEEDEMEEEDPRAELIRRLLEYKKYKEAAETLDALPQLGREVFGRPCPEPDMEASEDAGIEAVGLFELVEAFRKILKESPAEVFHEVDFERLSVADRLNSILSLLAERRSVAFEEIFTETPDRHEVVVTFLAMLELVKLRLIHLMQNASYGAIWLYPRAIDEEAAPLEIGEEILGYK